MTRRGPGFKDITGETFGHLTVVEQAPSSDGAAAWRCRCECGGEVVAKGIVLRRGDRRSCGCKDPQKRRRTSAPSPRVTTANVVTGHWWVSDLDGLVAIVEGTRGVALVEFVAEAKAWHCSACGPQPKVACRHVEVVTARLPVTTALEIASIVARKPTGTGPMTGSARDGKEANERAHAVALAKSAIERAERASRHDAEHRRVTGEVTVRRMTDEDRARLAERRTAKLRLVGAS